MDITNALLTLGAFHGRTGQSLNPIGIVIHYVANPGTSAMANRNYFQNGSGGNGVSSHYIVGLNGEILRLIPENERAMHAGRSYGAQWAEQAKVNNSTLLSIENCHPDVSGKFGDTTYRSLIWLTADICKRRGFNPNTAIFRHWDVSGKLCPLFYINNPSAWEQLKRDVSTALNPADPPVNPPTVTPPTPTGPSDWAKEAWQWGTANGFTDGTRPQENAKREEVMSMIFRAVSSLTPPPRSEPSTWAKEAWEWAAANGITDGSRPGDNAKREEVISMIFRDKNDS